MKRSLIAVVLLHSISSNLLAQFGVVFTGQELLGRPTNSSVSINIVANRAVDAYVKYGLTTGVYTAQTSTISSPANEPIVITIAGLQANTKYYYKFFYRATGTTTWSQRTEHSFRTQRATGNSFTFDITSDSHVRVGGLGSPTTWKQTLTNLLKDNPDFLVDCGDTFNMDTISSQASANNSYIFQRSSTTLGLVSHSVPIFLAAGNHEQKEAWHLDDKANPVNSQPVWGTNAEKRYFLNPVPDNFYSGNSDKYFALNGNQLRGDYYAWTWGNALFIVIDPFWYTTAKPFIGNTGGGEPESSNGDRWRWTLGDAQYNWLRQTLQNSAAKYKFLFMHHMTGGTQDYIRGGAYAATFCEWGGYDENGTTYSFTTKRPNWPKTIHQLLVDNHVSAVFHGHDHQYAYELRDGIVYQSLPAAGFGGNGFNVYSQTNPLTKKVLPSPGHLRITVTSTATTVDYISSGLGTNGTVSYSYTIAPYQNLGLVTSAVSFTLETGDNKKVELTWQPHSQIQSKQFIVQRSIANSKDFTDVGTITTTNAEENPIYHFSDVPGTAGSYLYRIVSEDGSGKKLFSDMKLAILKNEYRQITDNGAYWQVHTDRQINYSLFDMQGRLIEKGSFIGTKIITKPVGNPLYVLRTEYNGEILVQKLVR